MVNTVLIWWLSQLRSLLPERWRDPAARMPDALIVDCGALGGPLGQAELVRRRRRREHRLGPLGAGAALRSSARCIVRLTGSPLQRDVVMPTAVEANIARVLAYDMGRLAPFEAPALFWNWRIVRRDEVRKRLTVQLWYLPRQTLQPLLDMVGRFDLAPSELEIVEPSGQLMRLRLREPVGGQRRVWWIAAPALLVLLALLATPFILQLREMGALSAELATLQPQAQRVEQLRDRLVPRAPSAAANAAEAKRLGDVLQVLAAVTRSLPDDTVLVDLTVQQRRLTMTGSSEQAAQLIAELSASQLLRDPVFVAPIVRDLTTGRDSFSLRAELRP
jgi:general secretion pathway protein L